MKKSVKNIPIQNLLTSMLKDSKKAMLSAGAFYSYIAQQVRNGFIRSKFTKFSEEESKKHKDTINTRLKLTENKSYTSGPDEPDTCEDISSYSLIGALHRAKELAKRIIKMSKEEKKKDRNHPEVYNEIIKDEKKYCKALKKEEHFPRPE
ncbi:MAG: hypothetical protein Q8R38_02410 [Candidatus Omnitrophota bacterium]|nr:hypothetical protein [Candidatus Omnitrophota bacterium]